MVLVGDAIVRGAWYWVLDSDAFFFCSHAAYLYYGDVHFRPFFPSAVRAVVAHCNLPFALFPGLSQVDMMHTKEITKEKGSSGREGQKKAAFPLHTPLLQPP